METIRTIVRNVLVIIMTAAFLEVVLPRSDIKRYINLVIGLFLVMSVLNPFLQAMRRELSFDVFDRTAVSREETAAIIGKGREIAAGQKLLAVRQYKEKLTRQVAALADLYPGVKTKGVEINLAEDPAAPDFGQVKKITVYLAPDLQDGSPQESGSAGVPEIRIESINPATAQAGDEPAGQKKSDGFKGLREMIAGFYGLTAEQVAVQD